MNWKSTAVSEVAKEKIWKEHVQTEKTHRVVFDTFRVNPTRMAAARPVTESINKRPKRFLDRERAMLESMAKRGLIDLEDHEGSGSGSTTTTGQETASRDVHTMPSVVASPTSALPSHGGGSPVAAKTEGDVRLPRLSPERIDTTASPATPSSPTSSPQRMPHPPTGLSPRKLLAAQDDFEGMFEQLQWSPSQKYRSPQTTTQSVGWFSQPLVPVDRKFCFPHRSCDITRFANELQLANKRSGAAPAHAAVSPKR